MRKASPFLETERLGLRLPRAAALVRGVLLQRYKRFLADVRLESGEVVTAHCVNTGAMEGLTRPGRTVYLRPAPPGSARKLLYTWELLELPWGLVGVDTSFPNRLVRALLEADALPWLRPARGRWATVRSEVPYGERSRVDFCLEGPRRGEAPPSRVMFLEVKNCHLVYPDGGAYFPDCVSARAAHHVEELARLVAPGRSAHVLFVVQMPGVVRVRPSDVHDPAFALAARRAAELGVGFSALAVAHTPAEVLVERRVPVDLAPYDRAPVEAFRARARAGEELSPAWPSSEECA